ncbi:MAG: flagellar type III secretion system pore protein FliP [Zhengella sp.]|uniref:flagellar type III secretion system pore protein FliP n=1 Tax=Zhengella sp. TaxID=2282762 RepID=UPI001D67FB74|nr:flagellar type III secretion system pore protein FliP [Notoacmeibacter sp.]MCC0025467.1 flagellar type III secretion system pore protein FliP [Brucellaceae bacterium]
MRPALILALGLVAAALLAPAALAQDGGLGDALNNLAQPGGIEGQTAGQIIQLFGLLTVLAVAPGILITVTSFTRFIIVFSILRAGLGLQTTPANLILISLAMFMTFYVMQPAADRAWNEGIQPMMSNEISQQEAMERISTPFYDFMLQNVRDQDLALFVDLARERDPAYEPGERPGWRVLVPAFMVSELRRGFEIGFLVILPFLVIDLVVATITMAMGMMMLPPTVLALPFKILFFVLIDGWNLLVGSMIRSFN